MSNVFGAFAGYSGQYCAGIQLQRFFSVKSHISVASISISGTRLLNIFTLHKFAKREKVFGTKTYRDITDLAFRTAQKFVVINDCSIHGLRFFPHTSRPCYEKVLGVPCPDQKTFLEALPDYYKTVYPEWELIAVSPYSTIKGGRAGATTYLLFTHKVSLF